MARQSGYRAGPLSREMHISRRQLQRYTRTLFGFSPQVWLKQQRLSEAVPLLRKHGSVKYVAFELGFKQVSHFSREFKLQFGVCPVSYLHPGDYQERPGNMSVSDNKWPRQISR